MILQFWNRQTVFMAYLFVSVYIICAKAMHAIESFESFGNYSILYTFFKKMF